jgi:threonylcarbamoyladenosine tRNA methylthiotransferase MtaB
MTKIITLGCRLNTYESEVMRSHAKTAGLEDTIIINTCAVTNEAERQSKQTIRKARRDNPDAQIIVTGCAAQIKPDYYAALPEVDRVIGNQEKMQLESFMGEKQSILVNDIMEASETAHHLISGFEGRARAFIQVQNGCDHRCTFCSIPFGRGNSRSAPIGYIHDQVKKLVTEGVEEIVLTGVDMTSYGHDLPGTPPLGQMIRRILSQNPDLRRVRLSSLDPVEIDDDLYRLIAEEERLMPHLHLSMQAGDDMILKRMKRRHLRDDIYKTCAKIRDLRPDMIFGADIIAGFPTESDEMFENTRLALEENEIAFLHVFPYSPREGTPAARMPQVNGVIKKQRAQILRELGDKVLLKELQKRLGQFAEIIVEKDGEGKTEHYLPVQLEGAGPLPKPGKLVKVRLSEIKDFKFLGTLDV